MPSVSNAGVRIHYEVEGRGEPLVLLHGWSCEGRYWREFGYVPRLIDDFTVILPDLRGHGGSDNPQDGNFTGAAFASDVIAVLDDMRIDSAHIFGYSLGGWVAFELAASHRPRVKTAIVGGAHPYAEDMSGMRSLPPPALVRYWDGLGAPLSDASKKRILAFTHEQLAAMIPDRKDESARLADLDLRSLLICGTNDARLEGMRRYSETHENCTFLPVQDADHLQAWFRSELPLKELQRFLRRADPSQSG